jgi:hypothetical protein
VKRREQILKLLEAAEGILDGFTVKSQLVEIEAQEALESNEVQHMMDRKTFQRLVDALDGDKKLRHFRTTIPMHSGAPKPVSVSLNSSNIHQVRF